MFINEQKFEVDHDEEIEYSRRKLFAVMILAEQWAGANFPDELIEHAEKIREKMIADGTWFSA